VRRRRSSWPLAGTVFEWYDFYLYGSLATIIGAQFFSAFDVNTRNIFALLAFAAGFLVRPFGALVFGRIGDLVGRKYTFLVTILIMGVSTFCVGLLPSYAQIGWIAPVVLIVLRMLQGLALGGEYGGAAVYVAEHAPVGRRGFYTAWIQTTATVGLLLSLVVILSLRLWMGEAGFQTGEGYPIAGWRIPFLLSVVLLGISVWIRLQMNESPAFQKMKEEGTQSKAPLSKPSASGRTLRCDHRPPRPRRRSGGGLVHGPVLRPVLPPEHPEGRSAHRERAHRLVAHSRHGRLPVLWGALGPHRPQAGDSRRLPHRCDHLLPALPSPHCYRKSHLRECAFVGEDPGGG
jgi:MFS family permease